jgi:hypothetical protein
MIGASSANQLVDENRYLNDELNRVETVLHLTRAEKDELSIRYNAISDRVSVVAFCFLMTLKKIPSTLKNNFFFALTCVIKLFPFFDYLKACFLLLIAGTIIT